MKREPIRSISVAMVHVLPDVLGSCPAAFHSLPWDTRLPGWQMTSKRTGSRPLLRRAACLGLQTTGHEGMVLFLTMVSFLAVLLLKQVRQKVPIASDRSCPVSVGPKHTFHANLGDGEKRN